MTVRVSIEPLSNLGVRIHGVAAVSDIDAPTEARLKSAFDEYGLLVMRGLDLDTEQQRCVGSIFGEVVLREKNLAKRGARRTQHVSNVTPDGVFGTGELDFHMDQLFWEQPLKALMLYGIEIPSSGGDTRFVDSSRAYDNMPAPLREQITGLRCRHAYTFAGALARDWHVEDAATQDLTVTHPIVWRDDARNRSGLWVNALTTIGVADMPDDEGERLLRSVRQYLYNEDLTYTHKWRAGDLVIWDNRWIHHARTPFDESEPRTLRRTTLL